MEAIGESGFRKDLKYGFDLDSPEGASGHETWFQASDVYHYAAGVFLANNLDYHMSVTVPKLEASKGVWHPSGFMVFRLGQNATLGALRLHVWPAEEHQREERGRGYLGDIWDGDIHDHAWYVDGLNITGYQDKFYEVKPGPGPGFFDRYTTEAGMAGTDLLRKFEATYLKTGRVGLSAFALKPNSNEVLDDEEGFIKSYMTYTAEEYEHRVLTDGDLHSINPGEFHAPVIPDGEFAATLAFNSHRVINGPNIMIGGTQSLYVRPRQPVTEDEWQAARERLLKCTL